METEGIPTFEMLCGIGWGLYLINWHFHSYLVINPTPTTLNKVITIFLMVKCLYHLSVFFYLRLDIDSRINYYDIVSTTLFSVSQTLKYSILLLISKGYQITRVRFDRLESAFLIVSVAIIYLSFSYYNIEQGRACIVILALLGLCFIIVTLNSLSVIRYLNSRSRRHFISGENAEKLRIMKIFFCCSSIFFLQILISQTFFHFLGFLSAEDYELQVGVLDKGTEFCCLGVIFNIFRTNRNWIVGDPRSRDEENLVPVPYYKAYKRERFTEDIPFLIFKGHNVLVLGTRRNEEQIRNSSSSPLSRPLLN